MSSTKHFRIDKHVLPTQYIRQYARATTNSSDELRLCVNQYTPKSHRKAQEGDITILAAHANGVGKELYEPLFDDVFEELEQRGHVRIRGIWIADVAWQGESGVLNEGKLGTDPSWFDHPRDLLLLTNHFRKQMPEPIFGLGHSMGGNHMVNLSLMHPRLLSGLILLDPVILQAQNKPGVVGPSYLSTFRRDLWPSRAKAEESFRKNPFYKAWDERILQKHVQYNLREVPTLVYPKPLSSSTSSSTADALVSAATTTAAPVPPSSPTTTPVTLTTTKHQEVFTFQRASFPTSAATYSDEALRIHTSVPPPRTTHPDIPPEMQGAVFYSPAPILTFGNLPYLRPRVLYLFAKNSDLSAPDAIGDKMRVTGFGVGGSRYPGARDASPEETESAVQQITLDDAGHFFPFEKPKVVAGCVGIWLGDAVERYKREVEAERREWEILKKAEGGRGGFAFTPQYVSWMKGDAESVGFRKSKPKSTGKGEKSRI